MEAPVPASALIHSATLVSAGIFLVGRHEVFTCISGISDILTVWCAFTAFYGGLVASYQTDLKKLLAYSTISHCGFLFLLLSYNNFFGVILYLHLHGWFKSYSFMAAGNIISKYQGYQDYRRMGGSVYDVTLELYVFCISLACLGGLPFLLGFFNKHYLLLLISEQYGFISIVFIIGAAFTGLFYTIKTLYSLLSSKYKTPYFNVAALQFGGVKKPLVALPTVSSISLMVFLLYPVFISSLSVYLLFQTY